MPYRIVPIAYQSNLYNRGLRFIRSRRNFHLLACYEGSSFRNLARHIFYDKAGKFTLQNSYLKRPKRYALLNSQGKIVGISVTISLPEFYRHIEYEDYLIIDAGTDRQYSELLRAIPRNRKAEIVTFSESQSSIARKYITVDHTHYWTVFSSGLKNDPTQAVSMRLMNGKDLKKMKEISKGIANESSPWRLLQFQIKSKDYRNYIFMDHDEPILALGVQYYCDSVWQISYLVKLRRVRSAYIAHALQRFIHIHRLERKLLIWRVSRDNVEIKKHILKLSGFITSSAERHLHFR